MADNIVRGMVTKPTYINGVLHQPGEIAHANLDELGVDKLGKETPGLEAIGKNEPEAVIETPIAAVAPHAPDAPNPQGLAPGTVISGTGRHVLPGAAGTGPTEAVGADVDQELLDAGAKTAAVKPSKK
jgi:hypothetical protein